MAPLHFRCWDPTTNRMGVDITLEILNELKGLKVRHLNEALNQAQQLGLAIMQSTGVTDKNGKQIFEGDIVQTYFDKTIKGPIVEIKYIGRSFCMAHEADDTDMDCVWCNVCEVIGNIYEHPDLLK